MGIVYGAVLALLIVHVTVFSIVAVVFPLWLLSISWNHRKEE